MDGMMENSNEDIVKNEGCWEIGICGRCVHLLRFDVLSGRVNVCTWQNKNRSVAGKTVKCDGFKLGSIYDNSKRIGDDKYVLEDGRVVRPGEVEGVEVRKEEGVGTQEENGALDKSPDRGVATPDDNSFMAFLEWKKEAEAKRFLPFGCVEMAKAMGEIREKRYGERELNAMRRERDRLSKEIAEIERRKQDLVVARNERIVWERRLKCVEVGSGVKIGDVEIRTKEEIEAVVRMFQEIEALREG